MPFEPMTDDEMYAIEFDDFELHEEPAVEFDPCELWKESWAAGEPAIEEPETFSSCPACASEDLEFAMHYADPDRETGYDNSGEMYHCRACGSVGDAEECASIGPFPAPEMDDWGSLDMDRPRIWWRSELDAIGVKSETRPAVALPEVA